MPRSIVTLDILQGCVVGFTTFSIIAFRTGRHFCDPFSLCSLNNLLCVISHCNLLQMFIRSIVLGCGLWQSAVGSQFRLKSCEQSLQYALCWFFLLFSLVHVCPVESTRSNWWDFLGIGKRRRHFF